jgi:uncharacterized membrane protein SirB2
LTTEVEICHQSAKWLVELMNLIVKFILKCQILREKEMEEDEEQKHSYLLFVDCLYI